jgi:hypothetical protein
MLLSVFFADLTSYVAPLGLLWTLFSLSLMMKPTLPSIDKHSHSRACGLPLLVSEDFRRQRSRKKG